MSITTRDLDTLQSNLPKVISPKTHGIIDYAHAAFFLAVGMMCRRSNRRAARAAFATSGFILAQSLLTDYRFGVKPVIPFETHGKMDSVFASSSWAIPLLFGFRSTAAAKIFELNSLAEASVVGMTDWDSKRARWGTHGGLSWPLPPKAPGQHLFTQLPLLRFHQRDRQ